MERPITKPTAGGLWPPGIVSFEKLAEQSIAFARRLQAINPIFTDISPAGSRGGFANMLKQPLVWDIDSAKWCAMFNRSAAKNRFVTIRYWNRRPAANECCFYTILANNKAPSGNGVAVNDIPEPINNADSLKAILKATIDVFGLVEGEVFTLVDGQQRERIVERRYWLLWLREGQPWPGSDNLLEKVQGPHTLAEPWLEGTLYTWPEYEPWGYRWRE